MESPEILVPEREKEMDGSTLAVDRFSPDCRWRVIRTIPHDH